MMELVQSELRDATIAFAFDIDGVLVNGKEPIPGARETLAKLQRDNVPFIFLTNSGGVTEQVNLEKLEARLGNINFDNGQIVQSHTPFRALVNQYHDKTILVLGGHENQIRNLAKNYGFGDVVTSSDIVAYSDHVHPFPEMTTTHHLQYGRKWDRHHPLQISAILVWSSPRDWCLDLQLTYDLLVSSKGIVGTRSPLIGDSTLQNHGYFQDEQPKLYFCNPDFEWSTQHEHPRFAQGAFREALSGIWNYRTKGVAELEYIICGKPTAITYEYGERALYSMSRGNPALRGRKIKTVYMIGDNPESDIAGANAYRTRTGSNWRSILVETGVHKAGCIPAHIPDHTAKDVNAAVNWALAQEGSAATKSTEQAGLMKCLLLQLVKWALGAWLNMWVRQVLPATMRENKVIELT